LRDSRVELIYQGVGGVDVGGSGVEVSVAVGGLGVKVGFIVAVAVG